MSDWYTLSSVHHVFWIFCFLCWSNILLSNLKYLHTRDTVYNFYEVQTTKCTKILYQTDTIRPAVSTTHCRPDSLVTWPLHFTTLDWTYFSPKLDLPQLYTGLTLDLHWPIRCTRLHLHWLIYWAWISFANSPCYESPTKVWILSNKCFFNRSIAKNTAIPSTNF